MQRASSQPWFRARAWFPAVSRPADAVLLPLLLALPALLQAPFLSDPIDADAGVYILVGNGILDGQLPYESVFDHKQPLLYVWYALAGVLGQGNPLAYQLLVPISLVASTWLAFRCGSELYRSPRFGYAAGLLVALTPAMTRATSYADAHLLALTPLLAGLVALIRAWRSQNPRTYFLAGLLTALAAATVGLLALHLLAQLVLLVGARRSRREVGSYGAGAATVFGLVALPFLLAGSADDLIAANLFFNLGYGESPTAGPRPLAVLEVLVLMAGPLVALALMGLRNLPRDGRAIAVVVGVSSLAAFLATGRIYEHYAVQLVPAFALLGAPALIWLRGRWTWGESTRPLGFLAVIAAVAVVWNVQPYLHDAGMREFPTRYPAERWKRMQEAQQVGAFVERRTGEDDTLLVVSVDPAPVYVYADRTPAGSAVLPCPFPETRMLNETLAKVRTRSADYILIDLSMDRACLSKGNLERLRTEAAANYRLDAVWGGLEFYGRPN